MDHLSFDAYSSYHQTYTIKVITPIEILVIQKPDPQLKGLLVFKEVENDITIIIPRPYASILKEKSTPINSPFME